MVGCRDECQDPGSADDLEQGGVRSADDGVGDHGAAVLIGGRDRAHRGLVLGHRDRRPGRDRRGLVDVGDGDRQRVGDHAAAGIGGGDLDVARRALLEVQVGTGRDPQFVADDDEQRRVGTAQRVGDAARAVGERQGGDRGAAGGILSDGVAAGLQADARHDVARREDAIGELEQFDVLDGVGIVAEDALIGERVGARCRIIGDDVVRPDAGEDGAVGAGTTVQGVVAQSADQAIVADDRSVRCGGVDTAALDDRDVVDTVGFVVERLVEVAAETEAERAARVVDGEADAVAVLGPTEAEDIAQAGNRADRVGNARRGAGRARGRQAGEYGGDRDSVHIDPHALARIPAVHAEQIEFDDRRLAGIDRVGLVNGFGEGAGAEVAEEVGQRRRGGVDGTHVPAGRRSALEGLDGEHGGIRVADEAVVADAADQRVVSEVADKDVVAVAAGEAVMAVRPGEHHVVDHGSPAVAVVVGGLLAELDAVSAAGSGDQELMGQPSRNSRVDGGDHRSVEDDLDGDVAGRSVVGVEVELEQILLAGNGGDVLPDAVDATGEVAKHEVLVAVLAEHAGVVVDREIAAGALPACGGGGEVDAAEAADGVAFECGIEQQVGRGVPLEQRAQRPVALQHIIAIAAGDGIRAGAADDDVGLGVAGQGIGVDRACQVFHRREGVAGGVAARASASSEVHSDRGARPGIGRGVGTGTAGDGIGTRTADEGIVAATAVDRVVAGAAVDHVVAGVAGECVGVGGAGEVLHLVKGILRDAAGLDPSGRGIELADVGFLDRLAEDGEVVDLTGESLVAAPIGTTDEIAGAHHIRNRDGARCRREQLSIDEELHDAGLVGDGNVHPLPGDDNVGRG